MMDILIITIVATIFVAGIGALIYIIIHRSKHKKEVLQNSQYDAVPNFGGDTGATGQQDPTQPMGAILDTPADQGANSAVMNDITQGASTPAQSPQPGGTVQDTPVAPQAPEAPQPEVNRDFPGTSPQPEAPVSEMTEDTSQQTQAPTPESPVNSLNIEQDSAGPTSSNILEDTETSGSVSDMAQKNEEVATDSGINDSKVPVTGSEEPIAPVSPVVETPQPSSEPTSKEAVPPNVGDSYTVPLQSQAETSNPTDNNPNPVTSSPEPVPEPAPEPETPVIPSTPPVTPAPEAPAQAASAPEVPAQSAPGVPPTPPTNDTPTQNNDDTDDGQGGGAQEMHI